MLTVTITPVGQQDQSESYWAYAPGEKLRTVGRTAGEALDALTQQLNPDKTTLLVVRRFGSDVYFSEAQATRLRELTSLPADQLTPTDEAERDALIESEILASARRTADLADALGR